MKHLLTVPTIHPPPLLTWLDVMIGFFFTLLFLRTFQTFVLATLSVFPSLWWFYCVFLVSDLLHLHKHLFWLNFESFSEQLLKADGTPGHATACQPYFLFFMRHKHVGNSWTVNSKVLSDFLNWAEALLSFWVLDFKCAGGVQRTNTNKLISIQLLINLIVAVVLLWFNVIFTKHFIRSLYQVFKESHT